jgi:aminoglycoside phosphotransferase
MEEVQDPSLRRLFVEVNRLHSPFTDVNLDTPFRNVGAWLRTYHALPKRNGVETRLARRTEFAELLVKVTDFLSNALGNESFFQNVASTTTANALEALPDLLPLGLGHGDYAMRNILVGPNNRVTILDTLARWQTSIYEDIAHFLVGLKMNRLQAVTQGLAFSPQRLAHYEEEFLAGYFGQEPIPFQSIRLYEILVLLNRWTSHVSRADQYIAGSRVIGSKLQLTLTGRFFRRSVVNLLRATSRA